MAKRSTFIEARKSTWLSVLFLTNSVLFAHVDAHSFITYPQPISRMAGCRIGGTGGFIGDCPGPCPNYDLAADADISNPSATWKRGSRNRVVWAKNNHEGGFVRWSIVPVDKMWHKQSHEDMAIEYNCWDIGKFECTKFDKLRDCAYDTSDMAFSKNLYVPRIYPDGNYVLSFAWYGGGESYGHFGDYYDCAYIRIEGGKSLQDSHQAEFEPGEGSPTEDGCSATVDRLGICTMEPCMPIRATKVMVPVEYKDGAKPKPVLSKWFPNPKSSVAVQGGEDEEEQVSITDIKLINAKTDEVLDLELDEVIYLDADDEISLVAETTGDVRAVQWYVNGIMRGRAEEGAPWTIAGYFKGDYYPWMHPLLDRRTRVSAKATGTNKNNVAWKNVEMRFEQHLGEYQSPSNAPRENSGKGRRIFHAVFWPLFLLCVLAAIGCWLAYKRGWLGCLSCISKGKEEEGDSGERAENAGDEEDASDERGKKDTTSK